MIFPNLVADFVPPIDATLLPLLAVLNAVGPIGRDIATPVRAVVNAVGAISRPVGAIIDPSGGRTIFSSRKLTGSRTAFGTTILEELGGGTTGDSRPYGRAEIRATGPRSCSANCTSGRLGQVQEVLQITG